MSNIDKQALREIAAAAVGAHGRLSVMPPDDIFDISLAEGTQLDADITALNALNSAANPATVLALLDELEAKDKLIDILRQDKDKVIDTSKERISKLLARVAELEAVKCKLSDSKLLSLANDVVENLVDTGGSDPEYTQQYVDWTFKRIRAAAGKGDAS